LPGFFHQRQAALDDSRWWETNIAKAPHLGWLREVDVVWENLLSLIVIAPGPKGISGEAATRVSTSRLCPRRPFQETPYPVTRLLRTALPNTPAGRLASELQTDARLLGVHRRASLGPVKFLPVQQTKALRP